jgi:hypothetical protein
MGLSIVNVKNQMALSKSVEESLNEAEASLRNALAFAARGERPTVCTSIAKIIHDIESLKSFDGIMDMLDDRKPGSNGSFGPFFKD